MSIYNIDLFGVNKSWKIFGYDKYSTKISIIVSFILYLFITYKLIMMLINCYLRRDNYNLKTMFKTNQKIAVDISNLKLVFCSMDYDWFKHEKWNQNYTINMKLYKHNKLNSSQEIKKCSDDIENFSEFYSFNNTINDCYCFKSKQDIKLNANPDYQYETMEIQVSVNNNLTEHFYLGIYMTDNYFDYSKYPNPIQQSIDFFAFRIDSEKFILKDIYVNKLNYEETQFDYEFNNIKSNKEESYFFSEKTHTMYEDSINNLVASIFFRSNKKVLEYEIILFTIDYIFAVCGGLFQVIYYLLNIFCQFYNESQLDKYIMKKIEKDNEMLKFDIKNIYHNIKIIDNDIQSNRSCQFKINRISKKKNLSNILSKDYYNMFDYEKLFNLYTEVSVLKKLIFSENTLVKFQICNRIERIKFSNREEKTIVINDSISKNLETRMNMMICNYGNYIYD